MKGTVYVLASAVALIVVTHPLSVNAPAGEPLMHSVASAPPVDSTPQLPELPAEAIPSPEIEEPSPTTIAPADPESIPSAGTPLSPTPPPFYASLPLAAEEVNRRARSSLVNILCLGSPPLKSTSGTGILVTDTGMVLTNAHIGQHVLLADSGAAVSCVARIGSPATTRIALEVVYLPPQWATEHADLLLMSGATGTGESDFAILQLETPLPASLSPLPMETRGDNPFEGGHTLAAYPAEFVATADVQRNLHALSTSVRVHDVYTFSENVIDIISLGANPLAQQGASGGAVVNAWGYLVGLITTTTIGNTTGDRDLRAITIGHIFRELDQRGISPQSLFSREPSALKDAASQTASSAEALLRTLD